MVKINMLTKRVITSFFALSGGVLIGVVANQNSIHNSKFEQSNSSMVAIVNHDNGVIINKNKKNYGSDLIKETKGIVQTTDKLAKKGINNNEYSAYIIIPENFSKNFVSISTSPKQNKLKYEINKNLSKDASTQTLGTITKLNEDFNDKLGYRYISAILGEFHKGQDNAKDVLVNEQKDKDVIMNLSNHDLITMVDINKPIKVSKTIDKIEKISDYNDKNYLKQLQNSYNQVHLESEKTLNDLKKDNELKFELVSELEPQSKEYIGNDLKNILTSNDKFSINLPNLNNTNLNFEKIKSDNLDKVKNELIPEFKKNFANDVENQVDSSEKLRDILNKYQETYEKHNNEYTMFKNFINTYINNYENLKLNNQESEEETETNDNEKNSNNIEQDLNLTAEELALLKKTTDPEIKPQFSINSTINFLDYSKWLYKSKLYSFVNSKLDVISNNIDNVYDKVNNFDQIKQKELTSDFKDYSIEQKNVKEELSTLLKARKEENKELFNKFNNYELNTIDSDYFDMINSDFEINNVSIYNKESQNLLNYQQKLNKKIELSNNMVQDQSLEAQKSLNTSNKNLENSLNNAKNSKAKTLNENTNLLNNLVGKLQYTRINDSDNSKVYNVINHPVEAQKKNQNSNFNASDNIINSEQNNLMLISTIIGSIVSAALLFWHFWTIKK